MVPICKMDFTVVGDDDSEYFRNLHGRTLNTLNTNYLIPVDDDQVKASFSSSFIFLLALILSAQQRSELHHRMLQFVFDGRNYVGPVKEVLQFGQPRKSLFSSNTAHISSPSLSSRLRHRRRFLVFYCAFSLRRRSHVRRPIDIADEFPRAEVIGVDLAPIQPRYTSISLPPSSSSRPF